MVKPVVKFSYSNLFMSEIPFKMASVRSSSDIDLSSIADGEEEPLGDLNDEELFDLVQKTVYVFYVL